MKLTTRTTTLLFLGISFLTFTSCKKNDTPAKSKAELLTKASWKIVKTESKTGTGAWVDDTGSLSPCDKDDLAIFSSNGTYESNEGATKCSPTDPQIIEAGNWVFESNETQLKTTATGSSSPYVVSIDQLDDNTFINTETYSFGGTTYYYRTTLGH